MRGKFGLIDFEHWNNNGYQVSMQTVRMKFLIIYDTPGLSYKAHLQMRFHEKEFRPTELTPLHIHDCRMDATISFLSRFPIILK